MAGALIGRPTVQVTMDLGLVLGLVRGLWGAIRWSIKRPEARAKHRTDLKAVAEQALPVFSDDRYFRGEAIVRDLSRQDAYPTFDERRSGISPWFEVEVKG
jgi:hypothetical protein